MLDARKGLNMFRKVEVPVLGVIENMSYYVCPSCGHREHVFSHGGARQAAEQLEADFLGEIPLDIKIREMADEGTPIVVADPQGAHAKAYGEIARKVRFRRLWLRAVVREKTDQELESEEVSEASKGNTKLRVRIGLERLL